MFLYNAFLIRVLEARAASFRQKESVFIKFKESIEKVLFFARIKYFFDNYNFWYDILNFWGLNILKFAKNLNPEKRLNPHSILGWRRLEFLEFGGRKFQPHVLSHTPLHRARSGRLRRPPWTKTPPVFNIRYFQKNDRLGCKLRASWTTCR